MIQQQSCINCAPITTVRSLLWIRAPSAREEKRHVYQDGSLVKGESVKLYHSTRRGRLHNIMKVGVQASIPSHKTEGLWAFAVQSIAGYQWGRTGLQTTHGSMLELQSPETTVIQVHYTTIGKLPQKGKTASCDG